MRRYRQGRLDGPIANKIRQMIEADKIGIQVIELWMQHGDYRHATWDLARWGGFGKRNGTTVTFASWYTMTQCVRMGIVIAKDDVSSYEISPLAEEE
jgi:hypothetical protein